MSKSNVARKLVAILAADVAGYSRLMGEDEAGTLATMKAHRRELWTPEIEKYGGRIVGTAGDSILVEFTSAVAAVECAIAVQQGMVERNASLSDDRRMLLRVGVNSGEVIVDQDDIYGDGVNIAARLQELAEPGRVCISDDVHRQVEGKTDLTFEDAGEQRVKNIARPIRVWRWAANAAAVPAETNSERAVKPLSLPDKPSIAVLPFDNLSGDPEQEFFADGMAEDVITALSKYRWFFVIARNSSFTYKGTATNVKRVAQELGVRYVLEGSVRKGGDRIRVTAQLIDAETGNHIWAERYDRNVADIFAVQDEITEQIVASIEPELGTAERKRARRKPPQSLDAWDCFQRGLWHVHHMNEHDHSEAERLMRQVVEIDPDFSPAYAYLAFLRYVAVIYGFAEDDSKTLAEGNALGDKAVSLDRNDSVAHFALARILTMKGKTENAVAESKVAIQLNPNCPHSHHSLGWALYWGKADAEAALEHLNTALRLNPRDPLRWITLMAIGASLRSIKRYDEAIECGRAACQYSEADFLPHLHLAASLGLAGRIDEAQAAIARALELRPELTITFMSERYSTLHPGMGDPLFDGLRIAGLPE